MFLPHTFRFVLILTFLVFPAAGQAEEKAQAQAQAITSPVKLSCFTVKPPKQEKDAEAWPSCETLCAEKEAVCTGVQSHIGPPPSCEDSMPSAYGSCRCCAVKP